MVADHRAEPFVLGKRIRRRARASLLPQAEVHATDNLALLIQILERCLHLAVKQHPAINLDVLWLRQIFRLANGRNRSGDIARYLVPYLVVLAHLVDGEVWPLQAIVRNLVSARLSVRRFQRLGIAGIAGIAVRGLTER